MVGRFDFKLPGNVTYQSETLLSEGKEEVKEVEEAIGKMPNTDFFFTVKR